MNLPARFIRGQALTADRLNDLIEAIRRARPLPGAGVSTRESPDGTFISAAAQTQTAPAVASTPFSHRWKVTVTTVTDDNGSATHTLHITPGSLWRNDGAGVTDLNVIPDGDTVTTDSDGNWLVENATAGSLYVADNSANQGTSSSGPVYPLIYGDYTKETRPILLRIADLTLASSGVEFVQRQVGDALYSPGGSAGLQLGPMVREEGYNEGPYEADGTGERYAWYMGTWAFNESENAWTFAKAVKADGTQYPPAHTLPAGWGLFLRDATSARNEICLFPMPVDTNRRSAFLDRFTVRVSQGVTVSPPASDTDTEVFAHLIEEAIHREILEETGITVGNIRYLSSQCWPFPNSLMLGFTAEHLSGEAKPDGTELDSLGWFRADALPPIPPPGSIARKIIEEFKRKHTKPCREAGQQS